MPFARKTPEEFPVVHVGKGMLMGMATDVKHVSSFQPLQILEDVCCRQGKTSYFATTEQSNFIGTLDPYV